MLGLNLPPGQMCVRTLVSGVCVKSVCGYERENREGGRGGGCYTRVCTVKGLHIWGGQWRMFCGFLGWIFCSGAGVWAGWWDQSCESSVSCKSVRFKVQRGAKRLNQKSSMCLHYWYLSQSVIKHEYWPDFRAQGHVYSTYVTGNILHSHVQLTVTINIMIK